MCTLKLIKNKTDQHFDPSGVETTVKGDNKLHVKIPIDLLEEDLYRLHLELISFDEYGSSLTYDNPFVSFPFKVNKKTDRYIWPKQYYGNVREQGVSAERIS